jgi:hypothetical protein
MEPMSWRQPTGTFCKRDHPQFVEVRMVEARGVKQNQGQVGPSCFRRWCPAHKEFKRNEQQREG